MKINVIVPVWNGENVLSACIQGILQQTLKAHCIFVDNASSEKGAGEFLNEFASVKLVRSDKNGGFAYGNNLGIEKARENIYFF